MSMPRRRRRPVTAVVLALSLGINVFLIGWVATQRLTPPSFTKPDPSPEVVMEAIAQDLPKADGELVRRAYGTRRQELAEARARYLTATGQVRRVIGGETLDRASLDEALGAFRAARQAERKIFGEILTDVLTNMSLEGRRAFLQTHMGGH